MQIDDNFLVSCAGFSFFCRIESIDDDSVIAEIMEENYQNTELPVEFYLFQGLPKGDKLELIIQKTVELGVAGIIPVEMSRSVVKIEEKKKQAKQARWQAIAESAAKQSKRRAIPAVHDAISYKDAMTLAGKMDLFLVPYENKDGMAPTLAALESIRPGMSVGILIGPEGGFSESEIEDAIRAGGRAISLGRRILRTETAAITTVGMCMLHTEMHLTEESV
jgi:16S rRNA (uracil1498-N3)-methyltransferase